MFQPGFFYFIPNTVNKHYILTEYFEFQVVIEYNHIEYYRFDSEVNFSTSIQIFKELGYNPVIITPEELPIPKE
ncbi:MAG: hypothetical protein H8D97_00825 [Proteobacteria bacterium]|nr:hypothetical protein [Pseudomonadota bacterium]